MYLLTKVLFPNEFFILNFDPILVTKILFLDYFFQLFLMSLGGINEVNNWGF